jgi:hypothetical protein
MPKYSTDQMLKLTTSMQPHLEQVSVNNLLEVADCSYMKKHKYIPCP